MAGSLFSDGGTSMKAIALERIWTMSRKNYLEAGPEITRRNIAAPTD
jgi:hypothetical protein